VRGSSRAVLNGETHAGFPIEMAYHRAARRQARTRRISTFTKRCSCSGRACWTPPSSGNHARDRGSVLYLASNDLHGWRNPGPDPAQYFVMSLGRR